MPKISTPTKYFFIFSLMAGLILRLIFPMDMEWKDDEIKMYQFIMDFWQDGKFRWLGMPSGGGPTNPGLSVWFFYIFGIFSQTPIGIVTGVQITNILALLGFLLLGFKYIKDDNEKLIWLFGIILMAVNPKAIIYSRKIWAQDVLPFVSLFILWGYLNYQKKWGAFLWGLSGALMGQIHMSGFFLAFSLFILTAIFKRNENIQWRFWFLGSTLGAIGLLPWIQDLLANKYSGSGSFREFIKLKFYKHGYKDMLGLNIKTAISHYYVDFFKEPIINDQAFHLGKILKIFLSFCPLVLIWDLYKNRQSINFKNFKVSNLKQIDFLIFSYFICFGLMLSMKGIEIHSHYLIACYPVLFIFLARLFSHRKKLFCTIIGAQLLTSILFISFIHKTQGHKDSAYGKTYRYKLKQDPDNILKTKVPLN